ncbi:alpha/beta fold hydrolase [Tropicibacter alexandrii]|uniref:alpha/beta fold hydrolase n=1 Tax=Tropicibacter alexandrii TaxID=2267683 RepID=UPI0010088CF6|nr:alpha/beta hydrolase [Tropicibacter alexandrii]
MPLDSLTPLSVTMPDGATISYVRGGSGPVLIFLHGVMGDYRSWAPQWEAFTRHYDCIALSCRFNWPNGNRMEAPDHSAVENAEDIVALMDALGIDSTVLVGSSYGSFAALALAVNHPGRVRAVVASEPPMMKYAEMYPDTAPVAAAFREATVIPSRAAFERGEDDLGAMLLTGGIQNADIATIPPEKLEQRRQNMMAGKRVALSSDEFPLLPREVLAALPMPVLLVTGANTGPIFKAMMSGISRSMPQARMEVIADAGHSVPQDQPEVFNRMALGFLASQS